jgi:hypothetical protein
MSKIPIHFFILNMDKNKERLKNISNKLSKLQVSFSRIKAIEGTKFADENNNDIDTLNILKPRLELLYKKFKNIKTNEEWIYDGSIKKSFPNCSLNGNYGTKGLTLSNIKAFETAEQMNYEDDWYCILEDDAEINQESLNKISKFINNRENNNVDIVLLDSRHFGWGGCSGMLYNKKIIPQLIKDLHPLSEFSINSHLYGDPNLGNLWDWKLWKYLSHINSNFKQLPCIDSGNFPSTINE